MPTDWLFYWMTLPSGLAAIAAAIGLPFILWAALLGGSRAAVGNKPLASAYLLGAVGLLGLTFGSSYIEFSSRVSTNALQEHERWSIVPGWTLYTFVLSLIVALRLLGLLGVPVAALLLRVRRFSAPVIASGLVALWLFLSAVAWALPGNDWHRTHRLDSLLMFLSSLALPIVCVGIPFLGGIYVGTRKYRAEA